MANKYPTTTANKNSGKTLANAKASDFLSPGGFLNTGQFTFQLQSMNKAQAVRLLIAKVVPLVVKAVQDALSEASPAFHVPTLFPAEYWTWSQCPNPPESGMAPDHGNTGSFTCGEAACQTTPFNWVGPSVSTPRTVSGFSTRPPPGTCLPTPAAPRRYYRIKVGSWSSKVGAPNPAPTTRPTIHRAVPGPMVVPDVFPMAQPQPEPKATPWAKADPNSEPSEKSKVRPKPYDLPLLPVPVISNDNLGQNDGQLDAVPVEQHYQNGHGGGGRVTVRPGPTRNEAPGRGTKQKKINVVSVGGRVWVLLNMATEGIDFVQAMWQAIPKEHRRKCTTPQCMLRDLYDNMGEIDMEQAVENYLNMQLTDYLSALLGVPTKKLSQVLGHITGVDHAINQMTSMWQLASKNDGKKGIEVNMGDLFPKIDFSVTDGTVNLKVPAIGEVQIDLATLGVSTGGKP